MSSLAQGGFLLFAVFLFVGLYLSLYGLPGAIVIALDVLFYAIFSGFSTIGWKVLLACFILAAVAETIDFLLGLTGVHKPLVMKQSLWATAIGGALGVIALTPLLMGPGLWAGFFLGALVGLILVETRRQSAMRVSYQASTKSFLGMMGQKTLKGLLSLTIIFIALSNIYS